MRMGQASSMRSSFQILWNEDQLKNREEYGDGLYDLLSLVRTDDQEKARYIFLEDVHYLMEENEVDDLCSSPELDGNYGKPTSEDNIEEQDIRNGGSSWENSTPINSSCEQHAIAGNDCSNSEGGNNGASIDAKPPHQDNPYNSDAMQLCSWDYWSASFIDGSTSAVKWTEANDSGNNKGWDGWGAKTVKWKRESENPWRPTKGSVERDPQRQRFAHTTEEKNILLQLQPIMQRVKAIFREAGEGARFSPEDDKFIRENVLEHHPEKQSKVSGEIGHIMVDKHQIFQDTRCFFVVSTDGSRSDFSYLKCMENFVRKNCVEHADVICTKYIRSSRRGQASAVGGAAPGIPAEAEQGTAALPETSASSAATPAQDILPAS